MDDRVVRQHLITPELYFLISRFLANGPLKETARVLAAELERFKILPKRLDWTGSKHDQTFEELERKYSHIGPQYLFEICTRIGPILDKEIAPSVPGIISLLGAGRQSLLRTKESVSRPRGILDHCTRLHGAPVPETISRRNTNNIVQVLFGRESAGPLIRRQAVPSICYGKQNLLRRTLGHLSAVYCVLFDRSGRYIITGADDLLVKLWSAIDGRLLTTFRGASAEITDIAVNLENTLLAAGSLDRVLRVWDLQNSAPIAILQAHTGLITSVNFCPSPRGEVKYLVTTSTDGSIAFWQYSRPKIYGGKTVFVSKPIQYMEKLRPGQAKIICASFSPGGQFVAAGSADNHVRVYMMNEEGPNRILEVETHADTVDSIQWAHSGLRFISGSKDGTAQLWHFESQQWKNIKLNMTDRLPGSAPLADENKKLKVTMVAWDVSDDWVMTAVNDYSIKVWNSSTQKLHKVLLGHTNEVYVLESHPRDPHVCLSAGHDGHLFIWDIYEGIVITRFENNVEYMMNAGIYDAKWSPDGTMVAATDSHGHILIFGFGTPSNKMKRLPKELFFHTDYRPLIRDANYMVLDEQTQTAPHLMPPPFLVDVDGNPHSPSLQRLVPGRESCPTDQLVPNIGMEMNENAYEPEQQPPARSEIDRLIEALAAAQQNGPNGPAPDSNENRENQRAASPRNYQRILRRGGEVEGVRQSFGNWQRDGSIKWIRRTFVRPMNPAALENLKNVTYQAGCYEMEIYKREMRKRPPTNPSNQLLTSPGGRLRTRRSRQQQPGYRTRARQQQQEDEELASSTSTPTSSDDTTVAEEELEQSNSSSSDSESSDYSDWVANEPTSGPANLQPPKRSKRKPVNRRAFSPHGEAATAGTATASTSDGGRRRRRDRDIPIPIPLEAGEVPELYRPPEWLSEVIPRKAPYYPQMGDEVIYLRQGHQRYLEAVRSKNVYDPGNRCEPWAHIDLPVHALCKVIGIKYEIKPPRLCCLKLGLMEEDGSLTGRSFAIKYHDMPDVLDFLVLRQTFEIAVNRNWTTADRFRCMIDDSWWLGEIESHVPLSPQYPASLFMCFKVRWDNGEYEFMSPWDLEPIDESRLPAEVGGGVPVLPEELQATLYKPKVEEWPRGDRDETCRRIIAGLEEVMGLAIADPFLAPVDLSLYPAYAFVVEYPIDLTTIKARFENHFYRRITSAQFDVRYLATNAEKFNQSHSNIVKHARIVTDLCLKILNDPNPIDVPAVYRQLVDNYHSSDSEGEQAGPEESRNANRTRTSAGSRRSRRLVPESGDWRVDCRELLEMIWQCGDSTPFREPVDTLEHPDYLQIVDTPMDLRTVKEDLLGNNYECPLDFAKDMRLIFTNSRNYNTNKRSRIYSMTLRLSSLFEAHIKPVIYNWKVARRRKSGASSRTPAKKPTPAKRTSERKTRNNGSAVPGPSSRHDNSDQSDDDDDHGPSRRRRAAASAAAVTRRLMQPITNGGVSSSNAVTDPQPGPSARSRTQRHQERTPEASAASSSSSSSSDDSSEEESSGIPKKSLGVGRGSLRKTKPPPPDDDSGDSYQPYSRRRRTAAGLRIKRGRKRKATSTSKNSGRPKKSETPPFEPVEEEEEAKEVPEAKPAPSSNDDEEQAGTSSQRRSRRTRNTKTASSSSEDQPQRRSTRKRYDSDQSYHLENDMPRKRRTIVESDTEHEMPRPTRASVRRAEQNWGRSTEDDSHDSHAAPSTSASRLRTRRPKPPSESENSPEEASISKRVVANRPVRSTRTTRTFREDDDDQPSPSTSRSQRTAARQLNGNTSPRYSFRDAPTSAAATDNLRHSRRILPARSQQNGRPSPPLLPHEVDHNYGETRRTHITATRSLRSSQPDSEESVGSRLRQRTVTSSSVRRNLARMTSDSDDDNTPLNIVAASTSRQQSSQSSTAAPTETTGTSTAAAAAAQRNTRQSTRHNPTSADEDPLSVGPTTRRQQKRPRYNEDSDESGIGGVGGGDGGQGVAYNTRKRRAVISPSTSHSEDFEENTISISSRGRVRKINARAARFFRD